MRVYFRVPESMNNIRINEMYNMYNGQNGVSDVFYTHLNTQTINAYADQTLSNQFIVKKNS